MGKIVIWDSQICTACSLHCFPGVKRLLGLLAQLQHYSWEPVKVGQGGPAQTHHHSSKEPLPPTRPLHSLSGALCVAPGPSPYSRRDSRVILSSGAPYEREQWFRLIGWCENKTVHMTRIKQVYQIQSVLCPYSVPFSALTLQTQIKRCHLIILLSFCLPLLNAHSAPLT